jgi:hypothetical protein
MQGKAEAKKNRGRPPTSYIDNVKADSGLQLYEVIHQSRDRDRWRHVVACCGTPTDGHGDSARKYLQKLRENNVEGIDIMQITGHKNVASIINYSTLSKERHKKISNILSKTETNRNALVPVVSNLPRTTSESTNSTASSDVSCRSNPDVPSYCANTNMSSQISSMFYGEDLHINTECVYK